MACQERTVKNLGGTSHLSWYAGRCCQTKSRSINGGVSNSGKDIIKRRTDRKRLQRAFAEITGWCRENRHQRIRKQTETMKLKLQGHYNYYGIAGNCQGIRQFFDGTMRIWYRWLNRRSQRRSYTWKGFKEMTKQYGIPRPKVVEQWWIKPSIQYRLEFT